MAINAPPFIFFLSGPDIDLGARAMLCQSTFLLIVDVSTEEIFRMQERVRNNFLWTQFRADERLMEAVNGQSTETIINFDIRVLRSYRIHVLRSYRIHVLRSYCIALHVAQVVSMNVSFSTVLRA